MGGALHCGISDTVRFVFGDLNYHNQISIKDNSRGDAYGCIYVCSRGVPRVRVPSVHTFRVYYILTSVGISLFVLLRWLW